MIKIQIYYGTRPELIKLAPIILKLSNDTRFQLQVIHTGQHKELTLELETFFGIIPDIKLDIMVKGQSLNKLISKIINFSDDLIINFKPDLILIQGDTSTVTGVSIAAFYSNIRVGHLEAGLRSFNLHEPFPEEYNRKITTIGASLHFAPTKLAVQNLLNEGINKENIFLTGNTIVDATLFVKDKVQVGLIEHRSILITAHRRENLDSGLKNICVAIKILAEKYSDLIFNWPLHPNPRVQEVVRYELRDIKNINLLNPLNYNELIKLMIESTLIWSDSGGIQEEVPTFKKPILILRNLTERPEVIESGFGVLVGVDIQKIVDTTSNLLDNENLILEMTKGENPFGDGKASDRIIEICANEKNTNNISL